MARDDLAKKHLVLELDEQIGDGIKSVV